MAVASLNLAVLPVDEQLGPLVPADLPGCVNSLNLRLEMPADAVRTVSADIPPAIRIGHNVMRFILGHTFFLIQIPYFYLLAPLTNLFLTSCFRIRILIRDESV